MSFACTNYVFDTGEAGELKNEGQTSTTRQDKQAHEQAGMSPTQGKSRSG